MVVNELVGNMIVFSFQSRHQWLQHLFGISNNCQRTNVSEDYSTMTRQTTRKCMEKVVVVVYNDVVKVHSFTLVFAHNGCYLFVFFGVYDIKHRELDRFGQ